MKKKESKSSDILEIEGKCFGKEMKIILVYFDASRDPTGKERNKEIKREVEEKIVHAEGKGIMILGDFNGHLEMLENERKTDENGRTALRWMTKYNLTLLNADEMCDGLYTRVRIIPEHGINEKSAIDLVLVNEEMYNWCVNMKIDEEREILRCSDHNLISIGMNIKTGGNHKKRDTRWVEGTYYRKDEMALAEFREEMTRKWSEKETGTVDEMIEEIIEGADKILAKKFRRRVGEEKAAEKKWMTREIIEAIKKRRKINRKRRNCTDEGKRKELEAEYNKQRKVVQRLVREAVTEYEKELAKELRKDKNGGLMWKKMKQIRGKGMDKDKEDKIYEDGKIME